MQDHQPHLNIGLPQADKAVRFLVDAWAVSVEVFIRSQFGSRYIGAKGALVFLIVPIFIMFWQDHDPRPLLWFLMAYLVMLIFARVASLHRRMQGETEHSRYSGWPRLMAVFPWLSEMTVKKYVEPFFVCAIGLLVGNHNPPLAIYLAASAFCLLTSTHAGEAWLRRRVMEMNDAVSEQEQVAERFREMRGEYF
jgi:hypothetical protein